jgi:hypothetical protein
VTASPPASAPRKAKSPKTAARRWLTRFSIALLIGLSLGGGAGVFTVNRLEPGRANSVDSLQVMLDSIARGRIAPARAPETAAPSEAPVAAPEPDADSTYDTTVPTLVDLEEGDARTAILNAGLEVGEVRFQASTKPAGTVLGSAPAGGTRVTRTSAVSLVLSDGRPPTDTLSLAIARSAPRSSTTLSRFLP